MEKGEPIVVVKEISKRYGKVEALKEVSFAVEQGEIFGLIGPDGAGKSTLFRILTTLLLADKGTATVNGLDVVTDYKQIRTKVGYMPGRFSLYQDLSVEENLEFFATVFHTSIQENYDLIKDIYQQIEPFKKRRAGAPPALQAAQSPCDPPHRQANAQQPLRSPYAFANFISLQQLP